MNLDSFMVVEKILDLDFISFLIFSMDAFQREIFFSCAERQYVSVKYTIYRHEVVNKRILPL